MRSTISSIFAYLANDQALAMVFKLVEAAQKSWRRLDGHNQLSKLILGVKFADDLEVTAKPDRRQPGTTNQVVTKNRR
jgi:putative transposase